MVKIEGVLGLDIDESTIVEELQDYRDDNSISAVVIRINSPGGAVAPSQEIFEAVRKLRAKKSVVVSMGSLAASGGYYIAVAGDKIVANAGTLTGSIGVIMEIPNVEGLMGKVGVRTEVIKAGSHKDMASMWRTMSREERMILQRLLDDVHDQFIEAVADNRNMDVAEVRELADGRVFTGRQAKELGLVDEIGTLEDSVKTAAKLAGIEGEPEVVTKKKGLSIRELLKEDMGQMFGHIFGRANPASGMQVRFLMSP
ncbi:MAG: signal peptide peptidase SppA [Nitrospirae bacterium]|nr:signal peptide peptidase SppA [Nitrospirota bacterium]